MLHPTVLDYVRPTMLASFEQTFTEGRKKSRAFTLILPAKLLSVYLKFHRNFLRFFNLPGVKLTSF